MTEHDIEKLLRQSQDPTPPPDLIETLVADVPRKHPPAALDSPMTGWFWLRRWIPLAACLAVGALVFGVQGSAAVKLRRDLQDAGTVREDLDRLRQNNADYKRLLRENSELEKLREQYSETVLLRDEISQLRIRFEEVRKLRAENAALREQLPTLTAESEVAMAADQMEEAREKAKRIQCLNNLKQIGLAMHIWATKHNETFPSSWNELREELPAINFVICPSDEARQQNVDLNIFDIAENMTSYEFHLPGIPQSDIDPAQIVAKCSVHGSFCMGDGSARHDLGEGREVLVEGRLLYVIPRTPTTTQ